MHARTSYPKPPPSALILARQKKLASQKTKDDYTALKNDLLKAPLKSNHETGVKQ
jgi:hypothetical protein